MTEIAPYLEQHPLVFALTAGLFGLAIGSFLNVVIYRLPVMIERTWRRQCEELAGRRPRRKRAEEIFNLILPGSRCPHCSHEIRFWENIPILSFLWQQGRCSSCNRRISWRYPTVELLTGVCSAVVAWRFGFAPAAAAALLLTWALIALTFIDYDHQLLPDDVTLPLLWLGLLVNVAALFAPPTQAVVGAIAGYVSLWSVYQLFKLITGKEGMGYGDFKLTAALGAWLGWQQLPFIVLLSSFFGAVVGLAFILLFGRDRRLPIPFGPFLCAAGWVALLWGDAMTRYYLQLVRLA